MKWNPVLGCAALLAAGVSPVAAKTSPQTYSYAVTHPVYGAIGTYDRSSDDAEGLTRAESHLRIAVRVLGIVVRRETADQTEVWRAHRLISFQSLNTTNGRRNTISGAAGGNRFVVTSPSGTETAPPDVVASDPWSLNRMGPGTVVSTRTGKISSVEVTGGEPETIMLHGVSARARHYHVNTAAQPNKWEVWIDPRGVPIKFRSLETGGAIDFTLVSAPQDAGDAASVTAPERSR
jgi:hypothetical protein